MRSGRLLIGWLVVLTASGPLSASTTGPVRQLAAQCMECHGSQRLFGENTGFMAPKLGGQNANYIIKALNAILSGARVDNSLHTSADKLSSSEIRSIAEFYMSYIDRQVSDPSAADVLSSEASHSSESATYNDEEYDRKKKACVVCHSRDGNHPQQADYPKLAGQHRDYLLHALESYQSGRRTEAIMVEQVRELRLSQKDMERMALHYSMESGLTSVSEVAAHSD